MTEYLTIDDALQVVARLGFHVRDPGLLGAALARPATTVGGADAYPTLPMKAAALLESVVRGHPLIDGNKRTGWTLVSMFVWINQQRLDAPVNGAFDLVIGVAEGKIALADSASSLTTWLRRSRS